MRELVRAAGLLLVLVSVVTSQGCTTGEARLYDFTNGNLDSNKGIVQVCYNGGWTTVCGKDGWGDNSANVVCRQLGYMYLENRAPPLWVESNRLLSYGEVTQYGYLTSSCGGDERVLTDCGLVSASPTNCYYKRFGWSIDRYYYALATCQLNICAELSLRLVGGASYREGRVEVCVDGRWGTVCGEGWTNEDAGHVCTRLGYSNENATIVRSFGRGTGLVHNLTCLPSQSDCRCLNTSLSQCSHSKDIGAMCQSYSEVCTTEYKEELLLLTTIPPVEHPTLPTTTMEVKTPVQCQYPTQPATSSTINMTATPTGTRQEVTNSGTTNTLGALLGLLGVTLAAVLVGWIMTCVYCHQRTNKQTNNHTRPHSRSDLALQLINNPVHETGTYSLVGESDPQDYEIPTPTTEGELDYSKLQL